MKFTKHSPLWVAALVALITACSGSSDGMKPDGMKSDAMMSPAMKGQTALGEVLQDSHGMTLYTFTKDPEGKSVCNGQCAINWPPLMAMADSKAMGDWAVVVRDDGNKQWAYKGKPVYTFVKDKSKGDTMGQGVNNVWEVAKP